MSGDEKNVTTGSKTSFTMFSRLRSIRPFSYVELCVGCLFVIIKSRSRKIIEKSKKAFTADFLCFNKGLGWGRWQSCALKKGKAFLFKKRYFAFQSLAEKL